MEMKWKRNFEMEMETKKKNAPVQCFLHGLMSSVLVFYLAMVIWLLCLYPCTALMITYSVWLSSALVTRAMLQSSLVHMWEGLGKRLVAIWPWNESDFTWSWNKASIPTFAALFPDLLPLPVLIACSMWSNWCPHTHTLFYTSIWYTVESLYNGHHWEPTFCPL